MFKIIKTKILGHVIEKIQETNGEYFPLLINNNPRMMIELVKIDPTFIRFATGKGITLELLDIILNNPEFNFSADKLHEKTKNIIFNYMFRNPEGIRSNPECMRKLCEINGIFFEHCRGKAINFDTFIIAMQHDNPEKRPNQIYLNGASKEELKKFVEYDGRLIEGYFIRGLTPEIVEIAFTNSDPEKRADIQKIHVGNITFRIAKRLCEIDSTNFMYLSNKYKKRLLKMLLNQKDPQKKLDFDRIPPDLDIVLDHKILKKLLKKDKKWIKFLNFYTLSTEQIIHYMEDPSYRVVPTPKVIKDLINNKEIISNIVDKAKNGYYTTEELIKMISFNEIDSKLVNSDFFNTITSIICNEKGIDHNFFKYIVERSLKTNINLFETLNLEILKPKYQMLYKENGFEKIFVFSSHIDIQEMIIKIGNPKKEDGTVDEELGEKQLQLLKKLFNISIKDKNNNDYKEWIPYFNKIAKAFGKNPKLYEFMANHQDELTDELIEVLVKYTLGNHKFPIEDIEDLKNYEKKRREWIEEGLKSNDVMTVKEAAFEKIFGISYETAKGLYVPFGKGILKAESQFDPNLVDFFKVISMIINEYNVDLLKNIVNEITFKDAGLDEKAIINLKTSLKRFYLDTFNRTLFSTKNKIPDIELDGVPMFKAAGEHGDKKFNIILSVLGAYNSYVDPSMRNFNYERDWNRAEITNHGICTSYINNSFLGTAGIYTIVMGFSEFEEGALLLCGPKDIYSENISFDVSSDEDSKSSYYLPKDFINMTRHGHNEMVFERRKGKGKRQPSYIVFMCDDFDKAMEEYNQSKKDPEEATAGYLLFQAIKAAKDFGIPIVIVEREKIIKHERQKIDKRVAEFLEDEKLDRKEIEEYLFDIITTLETNHAGASAGYMSKRQKIDEKYFPMSLAEEITTKILQKVDELMKTDPSLVLVLLQELEQISEAEINISEGNHLFDFDFIIEECKEKRAELLKMHNYPPNVGSAFYGEIKNDNCLYEYNLYVKNKLLFEQLTMEEALSKLSEEQRESLFLNISKIEKEGLYQNGENSINSRRHIENVLLFASIISSDLELSELDRDVLLLATLYHEAGEKGNNGKSSSILAREKLQGNYPEEFIQMVQAVIEYHEVMEKQKETGSVKDSKLIEICQSLGIDIKDEELMQRLITITTILKDANMLDRTRFIATSKEFIDLDSLHYPISNQLIRVGMQINEHYAKKDLERLIAEKSDSYDIITMTLQKTKNPKVAIQAYKEYETRVSTAVNKKTTTKKS